MSPRRRPLAALAIATSPFVVALALILSGGESPARADRASQLASQVAAKRASEQALQAAINADNSQINHYQGSISSLQAQLVRLQADFDRQQALLAQIQDRERIEQARLTQLELQLKRADQALAQNLVSSYEQGQPDALTVILNAKGFADLIERIDFLKRVKRQNAEVITGDRLARTQVIAEANRLGALAVEHQKVTAAIASRRDQIDSLRIALVNRQLVYVRARDSKSGTLNSIAAERQRLEGQLASLRAAQLQQQQQAQARSFAGAGSPVSSPVSPGQVLSGGGFTFPLPAGTAVPPGSWSEDQGVDMAAAGNTPELAVGSGTIVLHGIGGFGPDAPVLHLDSPIDGQSYVYYGHAGPQGQLPIGTHVGAGQVMSSIGPGIVGISTGPHLEIGFADASGTPVGGTAGLMMSLLQGSYHG